MQKHLFLYAWIFGALALGILVCLVYIVWTLLIQQPQPDFFFKAQFVKEALVHAAV